MRAQLGSSKKYAQRPFFSGLRQQYRGIFKAVLNGFMRALPSRLSLQICLTLRKPRRRQRHGMSWWRSVKRTRTWLSLDRYRGPDCMGMAPTRRAFVWSVRNFSLSANARPNSVCVVHPKTGEEAWWPLFDEAGNQLFPELMPELDAIKEQTVSGLVFRRDHGHRRARVPLPWITPRGGLDYLRATVKRIIRAAGLRDELSFTSFRHGGFTEGADSDLSDAELRAAGRPGRRGSCRRTRSEPGSSLFPAPKSAAPSEQNQPFCRNSRRSFVGIGARLDC